MSISEKTTHVMNGADILVKSLVDHGVEVVFAYPGGASMPMHQALTRYKDKLRTILPRHEQGGAFAAQGYTRSTGKIGVVFATSGPGATNLVTAIADAKLDSIPMIAITGQVPTHFIGKDAFQETPVVEVCRGITKHHYLVTDIADLPRIMKEAFHIATTGRPGPVLVDMPKDMQIGTEVPEWDQPMNLPGYRLVPQSPTRTGQADCGRHQTGKAARHLRRWWNHRGRCLRAAARAGPQNRNPHYHNGHGIGCLSG